MKIECEISETEVRELVTKEIADRCVNMIWNPEAPRGSDWKTHDEFVRNKRSEILQKIDWKNAGAHINEAVIQKFFLKLLEK